MVQLIVKKWSEHVVPFSIFTSECASRHNAVHFFIISTSKSGPRKVCSAHFDFEICFAPQRRANFHLSSGQMAPHLAALASLLFDPPEPQIIGKTQFRPFRAPTSFSSDSLSSLIFFLLLFSSLTLPTSAFPSVHVVGSLTSKLPSITHVELVESLYINHY